MNASDFVAWAEAYYGPYKRAVKAELLHWLSQKSEAFLIGAKEQVVRDVSYVYGKPPDVALLNKYRCQETYDIGHRIIGQRKLSAGVEIGLLTKGET